MRNILKFYMLSLEKKGENYPREDTILGNTVAPIKSIRFSMQLCLIHFRNKQIGKFEFKLSISNLV